MPDQPMLLMSPTMRIKPEVLDECLAAMRVHRDELLALPNTLRFDIAQDIDDPTLVRTVEIYAAADQLDHDAHEPASQAYLARFLDWIAEPVDLVHYDVTVRKQFTVAPGSDPARVTG